MLTTIILSIISASDSARSICVLEKVNFQGSDITVNGNLEVDLASIEDCIYHCTTVNGCKGLTFNVETKKCQLKHVLFTPQTNGYTADSESDVASLNMDCFLGKEPSIKDVRKILPIFGPQKLSARA